LLIVSPLDVFLSSSHRGCLNVNQTKGANAAARWVGARSRGAVNGRAYSGVIIREGG
jgi:hypothetical protein